MSIIVVCESCRAKRKAAETLAGKRVRCKCGGIIAVPADAPEPMPAELDLSEVSLMSTSETVAASFTCPHCMTVMAEGAILCVQCGFNKQTGRLVSAGDRAETKGSDDSPTQKRKKAESGPAPAWIGKVVKLMVILAVVGGFGWVSWHIVAAVTFDPSADLEADKAKISPRMKVDDVVAALGRPPKEILTQRDPSKADNVVKFIPRKLFWSDNFMDNHTKEDLQFGFSFVYKYSEREQLVIWFNPGGEVEFVEKHDPLQLIWDR